MSISKALVIDDSATACYFMANALQSAGFQTSTALDGRQGLSLVTTLRPHCLIVDVVLPGINGYAICRQVRTMDPRHTMPIILVSVKNSPADSSYGLSLGADRYLAKPFTEETLIRTVWEVLPPHARPTMPPATPAPTQKLRFEDLIPRLRKNEDLLATSNPFAHSWHIDRPTKRLLNSIDGRKTVDMLQQINRLDFQHLKALLKLLYESELIEFCTQRGHLLSESPFSNF